MRTWRSEVLTVPPVELPPRPVEAYPWGEEAVTEAPRPFKQEPPEELDTLLTRSWPSFANEVETKRASAPVPPMGSEPLEARPSAPWPELPEPPPAESAEALSALRQWERLSRLDREQRGE